jgi:heat shock protein HtpX
MVGKSGGFWGLERVNRRRTWALVAKFILVLAVFGLGLDLLFHNLRLSDGRLSGIPWFMATAVALAVAQSLRANYAGADLVLGALGAHPISSDAPKNQTVIDVVHEMALAARIPTPRIDLIDDSSPNAFAIGRDPEHSVICVTQGLLDQMDREELQGVIGHEIAHIRNYDTRLTTMVTAMFRGFGPRVISILLSREREYLADASAVEFTRNPTALIRALEHIAKTESPLRCATPTTAQLFIVDPLQSASGGGGRSYEQFINEISRIRSQAGKTEEQRDQEARTFAAHEYPRNFLLERISSHPPLNQRIARLRALIGAGPEAVSASGLSDEELKAKFSESAKFLRNAASTDPEILAKTMQAALLASPVGRKFLQTIGGTQPESTPPDPLQQKLYEANLASTGDLQRDQSEQKLYEANLRSTGDFRPSRNPISQMLLDRASGDSEPEGEDSSLTPAIAATPGRTRGTGPLDSAGEEEHEREALAKFLAPVAESMRRQQAPTFHAATAARPTGSRGIYLFWFVIAFSAAAIVASFAIK